MLGNLIEEQENIAKSDNDMDDSRDGNFDDGDMIDTNGDGVGDVVPAGLYVGRGQGSHPVLHEDTLFITTTGSGDGDNPDGGAGSAAPNLTNIKVRLQSWKQDS